MLTAESSPDELAAYGRQIEPTCVRFTMSRVHPDGVLRPLTNMEMAAVLAANAEVRAMDFAIARWIEVFGVWVDEGCPMPVRESHYEEDWDDE